LIIVVVIHFLLLLLLFLFDRRIGVFAFVFLFLPTVDFTVTWLLAREAVAVKLATGALRTLALVTSTISRFVPILSAFVTTTFELTCC
jgi:hypothetical protein